MAYVYILECSDGTYYTGSAKDLGRRLAEHRAGKGARYTRQRLPVNLVFVEKHDNWPLALRREREIQGWRREKKKALVAMGRKINTIDK